LHYSQLFTIVSIVGGIGINICVSLFESPSLRYQYTYGDERPFWTKLDDILWRNTMGQIRVKMSENDVAMLYPDGHHGRVPGGDNTKFQKPAGWDYWDDLIPSLFEEMEEEFMEPYGGQAAL
jgi:hypothetical protein